MGYLDLALTSRSYWILGIPLFILIGYLGLGLRGVASCISRDEGKEVTWGDTSEVSMTVRVPWEIVLSWFSWIPSTISGCVSTQKFNIWLHIN